MPIIYYYKEIRSRYSSTSTNDVIGNSDSVSTQREKTKDSDLYYMAKGTGFGTGSIASNWDVDQLLVVQQIEESHINAILNVRLMIHYSVITLPDALIHCIFLINFYVC